MPAALRHRRKEHSMSEWPNGETAVVPIVGDPMVQVKSPAGLTAELHARGANIAVVPAHFSPVDLDAFLSGVRVTRNCPAIIVTVPHKAAALAACDGITDRARLAGSVNVIGRTTAGWSGDNTDGAAFLDALAAAGGAVAGRTVLLVGAGGAGSAIAAEFLARGAARIAVHDTDAARRDSLIGRLRAAYAGRVGVGSPDPAGFDIVANATPMGMRFGDPLPVDVSRMTAKQVAACVITRPEVSPFVAAARAIGCPTVTGAQMFAAQQTVLADAIQQFGSIAS
jgi:shikimate 5-dehydrogenase